MMIMCGGSPLCFASGRFTGGSMRITTLVLPSLNRFRYRHCYDRLKRDYMSGRIHRVGDIFLLSFSPLWTGLFCFFYFVLLLCSDDGEIHRVVFYVDSRSPPYEPESCFFDVFYGRFFWVIFSAFNCWSILSALSRHIRYTVVGSMSWPLYYVYI